MKIRDQLLDDLSIILNAVAIPYTEDTQRAAGRLYDYLNTLGTFTDAFEASELGKDIEVISDGVSQWVRKPF